MTLVLNRRKQRPRRDQTGTFTLRRRLQAEIKRRFLELRRRIIKLVRDDDAFGLAPKEPVHNVGQYAFPTDVEKLRAFRLWVKRQVGELLTSRSEEELWRRYVEEGMKKGAGASFEHVRGNDKIKDELEGKAADFYGATKLEFLRSSFAQPVAVDKVKLLASRSFEDLEGVTEQMSRAMSRTLTQGLVQGDSPREVARQLVVPVDSYANRALAIARTEIIRAHAEGQLVALKQLGVKQLGVQVEWSTSGLGVTALGNLSPCPICADHAGEVYDVDEAQGLIPFHPS